MCSSSLKKRLVQAMLMSVGVLMGMGVGHAVGMGVLVVVGVGMFVGVLPAVGVGMLHIVVMGNVVFVHIFVIVLVAHIDLSFAYVFTIIIPHAPAFVKPLPGDYNMKLFLT